MSPQEIIALLQQFAGKNPNLAAAGIGAGAGALSGGVGGALGGDTMGGVLGGAVGGAAGGLGGRALGEHVSNPKMINALDPLYPGMTEHAPGYVDAMNADRQRGINKTTAIGGAVGGAAVGGAAGVANKRKPKKDDNEKEASMNMTKDEEVLFSNVYLPTFINKCAEYGLTFPDTETLSEALETTALIKQVTSNQQGNVVKTAAANLRKSLGLDKVAAQQKTADSVKEQVAAYSGIPEILSAALKV